MQNYITCIVHVNNICKDNLSFHKDAGNLVPNPDCFILFIWRKSS